MIARPGAVTLAELLLVFWGFLLVLAALAGFTRDHGRLARRQAELLRFQEARRTTVTVLGRELRALAPVDLRLEGGGALAVRAVRGEGAVCARAGERVEVRYRGARRPDPRKDSVLLVGSGVEEVVGLRGVLEEARACGGAGETLTLEREPGVLPLVALVFESGTYHVGDGALRYRLGQGGRQPLTERAFSGDVLRDAPDRPLELRLMALADSFPLLREGPLLIPLRGPQRGGR